MRFSTAIAASAVAGAAFAADHTVIVGSKDGRNIFNPNVTQAVEGDTVTFKFWPKSHSVAQAAFASPCEPLDGGFWTGFVPTNDTEAVSETTYVYTVNNASAPVWFYCSFMKHCQAGMVGVINPPNSTERTIEAFAEAARDVANNESPSGTPTGVTLATASPSATTSGAASSGTGNAAPALEMNKGLAMTGALGMFAYLFL